ncbi:MAG: cysteine desulfurase NifS [Acidobacteriota bacterium]
MRQIYMDHSATTPVDPEVFQAFNPYYYDSYGNPSSVHSAGQIARKGVEQARDSIALLINASPEEIIFTSGGTEADNQAIIGYLEAKGKPGDHIITSAIEHHAVLETCQYLSKQGYELTILPVDKYGQVSPGELRRALRSDTKLVSIMHANNEIGTIQPIKELAAAAHEVGAVFHTDAVQTVGRIAVDVKDLGVDMLSASAHKLYGPKGIGCLYLKKGLRVKSRLHGGGQERKMRAGTENVPGIVGFGKAAEIARRDMTKNADKLTAMAQRLADGLLNAVPNSFVTGHPVRRLPGHVSMCFEFVEGESILLMLDMEGIMASSGSACTSGSLEPSHVLLALGLPHEIAHGSVRLTMGKGNTDADVDHVLDVLPGIISRLREMSPLYVKAGGR